jgi:signal transduction histidine kinase
LKSDFFKSLTFRSWLYFSSFAVALIATIWVLQLLMMDPYYRSAKEESIQNVADQVKSALQEESPYLDYALNDIAVNNGVCFSIYQLSSTSYKEVISLKDGIGSPCYLNLPSSIFQPLTLATRMAESNETVLTDYVNNLNYPGEMILYTEKLDFHLSNYYLIVNSYVEPVDYAYDIIRSQLILTTLIALSLAALLAYLVSRRMSQPIVRMTESARRLGEGDYAVMFSGSNNFYTELDELADTLNYATGELSRMDELRRDLVANVSHDIKTPLTMIRAYAEMVRDLTGQDPEKREQHLEVIITEANHLDRLVTDMLELSRLQAAALQLNKKVFPFHQPIREIMSVLEGAFLRQDVMHKEEFCEDVSVYGDPVKIAQVVYNFIDNAIKHSQPKTLVTIKTTRRRGGVIRLEVIDNGSGIAAKDLPYIWDRYYRTDKKYQRAAEGSGLGLAIAKGILQAHQAKFGVNSSVGEGSTFWFEMKIASAEDKEK